jgi:hypothetical protein
MKTKLATTNHDNFIHVYIGPNMHNSILARFLDVLNNGYE